MAMGARKGGKAKGTVTGSRRGGVVEAASKKVAGRRTSAAPKKNASSALTPMSFMDIPLARAAPPTIKKAVAATAPSSSTPALPLRASALKSMAFEQLVRNSDLAASFLNLASDLIQKRVSSQLHRGAAPAAMSAPSVLAETESTLLQAIVADESLRSRVAELEEHVVVTVAPATRSGERLRALRGRVHEFGLDDLRPDADAVDTAVQAARRSGLEVLSVGRFGVTVSGPARLVSAVLGVPLAVNALPRRAPNRATRMFSGALETPLPSDLFVCPRDSLSVDGKRLHDRIDDFVFIPPPLLFAPSPNAPGVSFGHLDAAAVRRVLNAPAAGAGALTGAGVQVAIIDTGFDTAHPFYAALGADFQAVSFPAGKRANVDPNGHGTAVSWNLLTMAPGISLRGYKHVNPAPAIEKAADDGARVISCSWGYDHEQVFPLLELSIRSVVEDDGVTVVFAAGNGHRAWPGTMPQVISVGGVYADPSDTTKLEASDYASGFRSDIYLDRVVPDVSGLCGMAPRAIYLPMPVPSGCAMDRSFAGKPFPDADETTGSDGWVYASGTSSAAPQVAGVVALLLEAASRQGKTLSSAQVRQLLQNSCVPVTTGRNAFGFLANGHPNVAVGWGLVNAAEAIKLV